MAIARVGVISGTNTTFASVVTTGSRTTTTGNVLIAVMQADTVAANGCTVTDSKAGNTWTRVLSIALAATFDFEIQYSVLVLGGASHTVTCTDNGGGVDSLLIVEEWSGQTATPLDKSTSASDATGASAAPNSGATATTSQANEAVIGGTCVAGAPTLTLGAGYTNLTRVATTFTALGFESLITSSAAAQTATFTAGVAGSWICGVATFKESGAVASFIQRRQLMGVGM